MHFGFEMLKHADALVCKDQCITTNNWCSVFQSAKEVIVTSFKMLDIQMCVRGGFLGVSQVNTKQ
jgi:hypothetical protein